MEQKDQKMLKASRWIQALWMTITPKLWMENKINSFKWQHIKECCTIWEENRDLYSTSIVQTKQNSMVSQTRNGGRGKINNLIVS